MSYDYHITIFSGNKEIEVDLKAADIPRDAGVTIGGRTYIPQGKIEDVAWIKERLGTLPSQSFDNISELSVSIEKSTGQKETIQKIAFSFVKETDTVERMKIGNEIDLYLEELEKRIQFSGSVVIKKGGKEVLTKAYGKANDNEKNTPETVFQIMSVSKQFTAAAILNLLEEKGEREGRKINISEEKIIDYLPEKYRSAKLEDITFKQVLTHNSGLINNIEDITVDKAQKFETARKKSLEERKPFEPSQEELISFFIDDPVREEFKGKPHYSNNGYYLLGVIIEELSGMKYGDYIKDHLLPKEMTSTGYYSDKPQDISQAVGYELREGKLYHPTERVAAEAFSAGGLYSTAKDLAIWSEALLSGKVVSQENLELMTTIQNAGKYTCGLEIHDVGGKEAIMQGGTLPGGGFKAEMCVIRESGDAVYMLLNNYDVPIEFIRETLLGMISGDHEVVKILGPEDEHPYFPASEAEIYHLPKGEAPHRFAHEEGKYYVINPANQKEEIVPTSNGRYLNLKHGVSWEFTGDEAIFHPRPGEGDPQSLPKKL